MKKTIIVLGSIIFLGFIVIILRDQQIPPSPESKTTTSTKISSPTSASVRISSLFFYPIGNYAERANIKWYGKKVSASEPAIVCGRPFSGYHVGDDLEIFSGEEPKEIVVYSMADGVIREAGRTSGYGGLIVIESNIGGKFYSIYYGHVKNTLGLISGQVVKSGQKLAILGAGCSTETDGERKHLHFAIREGAQLDVRGYVQTISELQNWIDPRQFLESQNANNAN